MKILLLGEQSGVHKELKRGLEKRGHQVSLVHMGDKYRKFESDIHFYVSKPGDNKYVGMTREILSQFQNFPKLTGFDVVQIITPKFFHWKVHMLLMRLLKRTSKAFVMVNTTCSFHFNHFLRTLPYSPCKDCKIYELQGAPCAYDTPAEQAFELQISALFDAIVSTGYEYFHAAELSGFGDRNSFIPLPIDTEVNPMLPFENGEKLVIYYGETRYGFKGGLYINEALDRLEKSEWADKVEIIRSSLLSFAEYQKLMSRCHVVLDQVNTHSTGMGAYYAMAKGKIVLTSMEAEHLELAGLTTETCPAINLLPDANQIYDVLVNLISKSPEELQALSSASRKYIADYHSSELIADQYLNVYQQILARKNLTHVFQSQ